MQDITSKTHRYISIRTYASEYILKKYPHGDIRRSKAMREVAVKYFDFYKGFVEFVTGKKYDEFIYEYMDADRCSQEEVHELTGILIACTSPNQVYCIPRKPENDKYFDYIIENCPCKFKVLKKTYGTYSDFGPSTFFRDNYKSSDKTKEILGKVLDIPK